MSVGRIRSVITPYVGPASSASTIRNVVAPVTSSPAQMLCWTGAAPRQLGSAEKCRLTQPCGGIARTVRGEQGAVGDDRAAVGSEPAEGLVERRVARMVGREDGDAELVAAPADGAAHQGATAAGRRVGTGDDADELVRRGGDRVQGRQRHLGRAGEDQPHGPPHRPTLTGSDRGSRAARP